MSIKQNSPLGVQNEKLLESMGNLMQANNSETKNIISSFQLQGILKANNGLGYLHAAIDKK